LFFIDSLLGWEQQGESLCIHYKEKFLKSKAFIQSAQYRGGAIEGFGQRGVQGKVQRTEGLFSM
jgi:hypothetical protein